MGTKEEAPQREHGSYEINADGSVTFTGQPTEEERAKAYAEAAKAGAERAQAVKVEDAELDKAAVDAASTDTPTPNMLGREGAAAPMTRELGSDV